ncbi:MAG: proline--tRNA ligase [Candidatus Altiarchaeota archaeon]|nr:proline--tRNA ligase [Candidatus Altiarchaeota archaeon]
MNEDEFSEWYHRMLDENKIVDIRYSVKGMPVYRGMAMFIIREMQRYLEGMLEENGHEPVYFPVVIPEDTLSKEGEHIKGFEDQVYWVTHAGQNLLERKLALRPTSETSMYELFSLWVRTHNDLPLKIHESVSVYRYETKHTRPLIRSREFLWNEGHTAFATKEEALKNIEEIKVIYKKLIEGLLCIPVMVNQRPDWDKFPGAEYTIAFETLMPDGKTLQVATVHNLGQHFSKVFNITYENEKGEKNLVWQTSYGPGFGRLLAAVICVHGDEKGLVMPPKISPTQAVIIPVLFKNVDGTAIIDYVKKIEEKLASQGVRVKVDYSDEHPGAKYYKWERQGVPLRIEAGPRDLKEGKVVIVRRDTGEKKSVPLAELDLAKTFSEIEESMRTKAKKKLDERKFKVKTMQELAKHAGEGIVEAGWCGEKDCVKPIDEAGTILSISNEEHECAVCGGRGKKITVAKTY